MQKSDLKKIDCLFLAYFLNASADPFLHFKWFIKISEQFEQVKQILFELILFDISKMT